MFLLQLVKNRMNGVSEQHNLAGSSCYYQYIRELGCGAFGAVLLHKNTESGELVAIKLVKKSEKEKMVGYFLPEAYILKQLDHKNVIKFKALASNEVCHVLVMEYVSGGTPLNRYIKKKPLSEAYAAPVFKQLVEAIAYIHQKGYAHMDIKPSNIYLCPNWQIKLLDFGLSLPIHKTVKQGRGTIGYLAPEVTSAKVPPCFPGPVDAFACGATLQFMLTGIKLGKASKTLAHNLNLELMKTMSFALITLLPGMLDPIPEERMTISQILKHSWTQSSLGHGLNSRFFKLISKVMEDN